MNHVAGEDGLAIIGQEPPIPDQVSQIKSSRVFRHFGYPPDPVWGTEQSTGWHRKAAEFLRGEPRAMERDSSSAPFTTRDVEESVRTARRSRNLSISV
jgi:ribosome-binding protein aMBF1 (putative translation factor)